MCPCGARRLQYRGAVPGPAEQRVVTGSSKGIGEAIGRVLAREGATVIVHSRDREKTERVAASIIAQGGRAYAVVGDLTRDDAVERLVTEAEEAGAVDIRGPIVVTIRAAAAL